MSSFLLQVLFSILESINDVVISYKYGVLSLPIGIAYIIFTIAGFSLLLKSGVTTDGNLLKSGIILLLIGFLPIGLFSWLGFLVIAVYRLKVKENRLAIHPFYTWNYSWINIPYLLHPIIPYYKFLHYILLSSLFCFVMQCVFSWISERKRMTKYQEVLSYQHPWEMLI